MSKPIVAIVGRPNVGKSTLFNVLAGEKISIVQDTPGVTRDRIYADINWLDYNFTLIDTGGIEPESDNIILKSMREQAEIAIETADVILFMTDVRQGMVDDDAKVADMLRRSKKPIVLVAAARQVQVGDHIILMCYASMTPEEAKEHTPKVVFVNDDNSISRITDYEKHGELFS